MATAKRKKAARKPARKPAAKKAGGKASAKKRISIALTGARGWFGRMLIPVLLHREEVERVVCFDVADPGVNDPRVTYYTLDLTSPSADRLLSDILRREKLDAMAHCAFLSGPSPDFQFAHELMVIGTMHVLNACAEVRMRRVCMLSTTRVYGALPDNPNYLSEDAPLRAARTKYVIDRVEAEQLVARYAKKHPDSTVSVLRPCTIMGSRSRDYFARYLKMPIVPTILGFDPLFQLVHESDAVSAYAALLASGKGGAYNVCGDGVMPLSSVIRLLGNVNFPAIGGPAELVAKVLWRNGGIGFPPEHMDHLRYLLVADGSRIKNEIGFSPRLTTRESIGGVPGY